MIGGNVSRMPQKMPDRRAESTENAALFAILLQLVKTIPLGLEAGFVNCRKIEQRLHYHYIKMYPVARRCVIYTGTITFYLLQQID